MQTDTTPNEVVKEFFIAGYLDHDYDRVMELVAEDYVDHSLAGARSNADAVNILRIVKDMFVDLQLVFEDVFSAGELVATRINTRDIKPVSAAALPLQDVGSRSMRSRTSVWWTARLWNRGVTGPKRRSPRCSPSRGCFRGNET